MTIRPYFIEVETLDEYLDVCRHRTYYRYLCKADRNDWYITEYNLKPEDLNRWEVKRMFKKRPDIMKMAKYHVGDLCKTTHGVIGIFRGVQVTDKDYYWIIEDFEKVEHNKHIITCVEGCRPYNTYKLFPQPKDLKRVIGTSSIRIRTLIKKKYTGRLIFECNGTIYFKSDTGLCIPTSEIVMYCKHEQRAQKR